MEDSFIEQLRPSINELKSLIITQVRSECKTYAEVRRFLEIRIQETVFYNNHVLTSLLEEVVAVFEEEKSGLSLK